MGPPGWSSGRVPSSPSLRYSFRVQRRVRTGYVVMIDLSVSGAASQAGCRRPQPRCPAGPVGRWFLPEPQRYGPIPPAELGGRVDAGAPVDLDLPVHGIDDPVIRPPRTRVSTALVAAIEAEAGLRHPH